MTAIDGRREGLQWRPFDNAWTWRLCDQVGRVLGELRGDAQAGLWTPLDGDEKPIGDRPNSSWWLETNTVEQHLGIKIDSVPVQSWAP